MSKEDSKYCPLVEGEGHSCCEQQCAWWDDFTGLCAVLVIARFGSEGSFNLQRREREADLKADRGEARGK